MPAGFGKDGSAVTETRAANQLPLRCMRCTGYGEAHFLTCPALRYAGGGEAVMGS
jgi:hypothetical protein